MIFKHWQNPLHLVTITSPVENEGDEDGDGLTHLEPARERPKDVSQPWLGIHRRVPFYHTWLSLQLKEAEK